MSNRTSEQLLDDRLEAMGRLERRRLLLRLATADPHDEPRIDFSELDDSLGELDPFVTLRHHHLPVLEDRGFIRWDQENHWVMKGPRFDELKPFLKLFREIHTELHQCD